MKQISNTLWERIGQLTEPVLSKIAQWCVSIFGGLLVGVETAIPFFALCVILTGIDVMSAYDLGRRMHRKHPGKYDGKFKSEHKHRIFKTMIIVFVAIILASHIDTLLLGGGKRAVSVVVWVFIFYQVWSILENWSSENNNKLAAALQRIMVNKAERHLNVPLSDILLTDKNKDNNDTDGTTTADSDARCDGTEY